MPTVDKSTPIAWSVGDAQLTRIAELEVHWPFGILLPGAEDVIDDYDWLRPDFVTDDGRMRLSMHSVVIESAGLRIIVDTCVGNDKSRPGAPPFEQLSTPFLGDLEAAGFAPETIDFVVCTHLHVDHVGWNTRLVDGQWVPTFPNARYLFVQAEYDYWRAEPQDYGPVFEDSVQPIMDAGLADLVGPDHRINDEVWFESTPGHTPGHVSVIIESAGERAVITGDMIHHPLQFARPDMASSADYAADGASTATRLEAFPRWCDGRLVIGTHFAGRTAGHIETTDQPDSWVFAP